MSIRARPLTALLTALAIVASACGTTDDGPSSPEASASVEAAIDATNGDVEGDDADGDADTDSTAADESEGTSLFPVTIDHSFGATTVESQPERVVTFGFSDHSFTLAMGVVPVALRKTFDAQTFTVWPWAQDALGDTEPELIGFLEPSFEQIAALQPDLILAVNANVDERVYGILSGIAPTIARPAGYGIQDTPWREMATITGDVLGRPDEAAAVIDDLETRFDAARSANPDFDGSTASVVFYTAATGRFGSYETNNLRYSFLAELGFEPPEALVAEAGGGSTIIELGVERLDVVDADVVVWNPTDDQRDEAGSIRDIPTRVVALPAAAEGREVIADLFLAAALTEASPLSWHYALDRIVPELAAAIDGDLATPAPSAVGLYELEGETDATADEMAAMVAWERALGSDASLEEKAPHIEDF
ncbi:MAG: ABC transporter substrate-binding protein, partial [Actinomycetota bacterium]